MSACGRIISTESSGQIQCAGEATAFDAEDEPCCQACSRDSLRSKLTNARAEAASLREQLDDLRNELSYWRTNLAAAESQALASREARERAEAELRVTDHKLEVCRNDAIMSGDLAAKRLGLAVAAEAERDELRGRAAGLKQGLDDLAALCKSVVTDAAENIGVAKHASTAQAVNAVNQWLHDHDYWREPAAIPEGTPTAPKGRRE